MRETERVYKILKEATVLRVVGLSSLAKLEAGFR